MTKAFHESGAFTRLMAGPIGSSKTTAAMVGETFFAGMTQRPDRDGVRRCKIGALRDTYRNTYATLIPTWLQWVPRDYGNFVGSDDRPAVHEFSFEAPYVLDSGHLSGMGRIDMRVEFRALGSNTVEQVCRGWELNGAYIDECDLVPKEAFSFLAGRVMRAGDKRLRVSRGVWGTFNKPDVDHWLYEACVEELPEGWAFFDQPGGLLPGLPYRTNPNAENLKNLDDGYYIRAAQGQPEWYVRRMLRNEWGASVSGELVFPEFQPNLHMLPMELEPDPGTELVLGVDGGGTPAAVIMGRDAWGRRIRYGEAVMVDPYDPRKRRLLTGVGPRRFAEFLGDLLLPRFRQCRVTVAHADPSMFYGADREAGDFASIEIIGEILKIPVLPAPSNEIHLRHEAVRRQLVELGRDGRPMGLYNPSCRFLRWGYTSDYRFEERDPKQPGKELKPRKTASSHVMDADQYAALGDMGRAAVTSGGAFDRHRPKPSVGGEGWRPSTLPSRGEPSGPSYASDFSVWKV